MTSTPSALSAFGRLSLLVFGLCSPTFLPAQSDSFDSASDAGWSKITSPNYPATYSFPADGLGGFAYRLQADSAVGSGPAGRPRVVAYRADRLYTNFFVAADIVAWDNSSTNDMVFGLIARGNNISSGQVDGVTLTTRLNRFVAGDGNKGQLQVYSFFVGDVGVASAQDLGAILVPGRQYRFVMTGVGNIFTGAVYDVEDLTRPLISMRGDDSAGPFSFPESGYVGLFNYSYPGPKAVDTTFDNFVASEAPPTSVAAPATPHGLIAAPQVVNRTPVSYANFYPAANGIIFNATTLTTTNAVNTNAVRLYLNGVNVSSGLNITGPNTNALVSYNRLTSNAVYDARIELQDVLGRRTTNVFTFDTFSPVLLGSSSALTKVIECEDFNYFDFTTDGLFIDNPLTSGVTTNGAQVNTGGGGYYGLSALNASAGGVDYFTTEGSVDANYTDFRQVQVQNLQGNRNYLYFDNGSILSDRAYETQRLKYVNADPALHEYNVVRTRGGMWMNYTRIFQTNTYFNVYLRHGCAFSQTLRLELLGDGPTTNSLGTFGVTNALAVSNYRYEPLRDDSGRLAVVNISGTNTLRLTVAGTDTNPTRFGLSLNYLAFVPALIVESAAQVEGPYTIDTNASVEPGLQRISIPQNGGARFFRLRWDHATQVTDISLSGGNVVFSYQ